MPKKLSFNTTLWIITAALFILWGAFLFRLNEPFFGHHEGASVWVASAMRTWNQYGIAATNFLPIRTPGPTDPETGLYYLNHPPLMVWTIGIATQLFGYTDDTLQPHQSSVRIVSILLTTLSLPLFYVWVKELTNRRVALIGVLLYGFSPVIVYFSRLPAYDVVMMPLLFAFGIVFARWMRVPSRSRTWGLLVLAIVLMWTAWASAFWLAMFGVIALIYGTRQQRIVMVGIGVITGIATVTIPVMYELLRPGTLARLQEVLTLRTSTRETTIDSDYLTVASFTATYLQHMVTTVSIGTTALGFAGIIYLLRRKMTVQNATILGSILTIFLFMAVVPNSWHFHDWYKIHFLPGFAIAAALLIDAGWRLPAEGWRRFIKPLLFATITVSMLTNLLWIYQFHQSTFNPLFRSLAAELPQHTEIDDDIAASPTAVYSVVEYNAYRDVRWGVLPETVQAFYETEERVDLYYVWCLEPGVIDNFDGYLAQFAYEQIADECRLIHLEK